MQLQILETILHASPEFMDRVHEVAKVSILDVRYCGHIDGLTAMVFLHFPESDQFSWRNVENLVDEMVVRIGAAGRRQGHWQNDFPFAL